MRPACSLLQAPAYPFPGLLACTRTHAHSRCMLASSSSLHARTHTHTQVTRTHFHDFMLDVHSKLRAFKGDADPLLRVADATAKVGCVCVCVCGVM